MTRADHMIRATLRRSAIGTSPRQRTTLRGLGLTRVGRSVILKDSPPVRGMLRLVGHLVEVDDDRDRAAVGRAAAGRRRGPEQGA